MQENTQYLSSHLVSQVSGFVNCTEQQCMLICGHARLQVVPTVLGLLQRRLVENGNLLG